jgi:hypothetical protein
MSDREIDWLRGELTAIRGELKDVGGKVDTLLHDKTEREASLRTAGWIMKGVAGLATSGGVAGLVALWQTIAHGGSPK